MATLFRERDWSNSPLGPMRAWPESLRTMVDIMLSNDAPAAIQWGREGIHLYNDAYRALLADQHPRAFGRPASESRADEALHEQVERYRVILENARNYAVMTTDENGVLTDWLPGAEAIFGWSRDEALGRPIDFTFTEEDVAAREPEKELAGALEQGIADDVRWHVRKDGVRVFIDGFVTPLRNKRGVVSGYLKIGQDATERYRAERALRASEQRFQEFSAASTDVLWIRNAHSMQLEFISPAFERVYGQPVEDLVRGNDLESWIRLIEPEDRGGVNDAFRRVRSGAHVTYEFRIRRPSDGLVRWIRDTDFPMVDEAGGVQRLGGIGQDVTDEKRAMEMNSTLSSELQHRVRNVLAIFASVASRSGRANETVEEYRAQLIGRLRSLSRTQSLLTRQPGVGVDLEMLIRDELIAQDSELQRAALSGPPIVLSPKAAEVLTLAIHELCTNAVKYGALHAMAGKIIVRWQRVLIAAETWLRLDWIESGVYVSQRPTRSGFGTELITKRVPYELRGRAAMHFLKDGLHCEISFPLREGESIFQPGATTAGLRPV